MQTVIMHIDFNSYFATCEQQDRPSFRGRPLGVCEHLGGIIIAPSIEAKRWGIKTGTPVWEARRLYPKIILTPTTPSRYRYYTGKFLKVLGDYTDQVDKYSIDEAFLDVTKATNIRRRLAGGSGQWRAVDPFEEARAMALEIKRRITREVGDYLKVSVGLGWNKLVAKICSDLQKPNGLVVARPEDKPWLYERLKLTDIPGIAWRQEQNLNKLGIKTVADLRDYPVSKLVAHFGIMGYHLHRMGQFEGSWKENFEEDEAIKSMGHMYTMPQKYRRREVLEPVLYKLSEMVGARLRANGLMGSSVHAHVHDADDNCYGKGRRLGYYLSDGRDIFLEAKSLLAAFDVPIKLVGVTVSGLSELAHQQSLFPRDEKQRRVVPALDRINEKYDDFTITRVPAFLARDIIRDSIGFGRMKEFKTLGRFVGVH